MQQNDSFPCQIISLDYYHSHITMYTTLFALAVQNRANFKGAHCSGQTNSKLNKLTLFDIITE